MAMMVPIPWRWLSGLVSMANPGRIPNSYRWRLS